MVYFHYTSKKVSLILFEVILVIQLTKDLVYPPDNYITVQSSSSCAFFGLPLVGVVHTGVTVLT